jgi:glycosyltransferase involved in cell wall biosynthesis
MTSTAQAPAESLPGDQDVIEGGQRVAASFARDGAAESRQALMDRLRSVELSARLHAMRATFFEGVMREREAQIDVIRRSTSWRLTAPVRFMAHVLREGPSKPGRIAADQLFHALKRLVRLPVRSGSQEAIKQTRIAYETALRRPAHALVAPRVLIIAELSLAQCAKYRVWQRQEHLRLLGTECTVIKWQDIAECRSALQTHALVIFYRVPGVPDALALIDEARRLKLTSYWEVDDLIFDQPAYLKNRNLDLIDPQLRAEVLSGVSLYRKALLACDRGIASTPALAEAMRAAGVKDVIVIENALDEETRRCAQQSRVRRDGARARRDGRSTVAIAYGSGSKAHNADFLEACPALAALMSVRPEVELHFMGDLDLPPEIRIFGDRVKCQAASSYAAYLDWLAGCDISLAPLENTDFNNAKSNIKYIEAAMLGLPSICSPRQAFVDAVRNGVNGFVAGTTAEWRSALEALAGSEALRLKMGSAAHDHVLSRYGSEFLEPQVKMLVSGLDQRTRKKMTVLTVNIFFWPQSYGGATIVAEELARRLGASPELDMYIFASHSLPGQQQYTLLRYDDRPDADVPVIAVRLPRNFGDPITGFDDPQMVRCFDEVLAATEPDIVHFHCLQGLGSAILDVCHDRNVPFVVTVHDAWWLCERQFMVMANGRYCGQTRIDVRICEGCIPGAHHLHERFQMSLQRLSGAARLLFPSEFHRKLHIANGADAGRCLLNRNGVRAPARPRPPRQQGAVRFGYVGGNDRVKGIHLVKQAFEALNRSDYELVLVDNTTNAGYSSMSAGDWKVAGVLKVIPAYQQDTMDQFFESIDVLLFPSQWKESFGLAVREALIRDVWVIATDGGGAVEDIVHDENGTILPFDATGDDLRDAVLALLDRADRLAAHSNVHKSRITTYDAQALELEQILHDVVFG